MENTNVKSSNLINDVKDYSIEDLKNLIVKLVERIEELEHFKEELEREYIWSAIRDVDSIKNDIRSLEDSMYSRGD